MNVGKGLLFFALWMAIFGSAIGQTSRLEEPALPKEEKVDETQRLLLDLFSIEIDSAVVDETEVVNEDAVMAQGSGINIRLDSLPEYPFLSLHGNDFFNEEEGMRHFYNMLNSLEQKDNSRVNVVHIGDSHIQADYYSGTVRRKLHRRFGAAGRGLVFPYKVAGTNGPIDIHSSSNVAWESKRNIYVNRPMPTGISGIAIHTENSNFVLKLGVNEGDSIDYQFNKVSFFNEKGPHCFDFKISQTDDPGVLKNFETSVSTAYHKVRSGESLSVIGSKYGVSVSSLRKWNGLKGSMIYPGQKLAVQKVVRIPKPMKEDSFEDLAKIENSFYGKGAYCSVVEFDEPQGEMYLRCYRHSDAQKEATIYGIVLENTKQDGILYNMVGVNGAKFEHYNKSEYFHDQVQALQPDLIVVSLGTNEAMTGNFKTEDFRQEVEYFLDKLRETMPETSILVTCPPDIARRRKYTNPNTMRVREVLIEECDARGLAFWDFYTVMGGEGSVQDWYKSGLGNGDRVHLTKRGYVLQGELFYTSLMQGFESFKQHKP